MMKLTDFSKTGSSGNLPVVVALVQRVSVSRSQDKKIDVVGLWVLESARSGQKQIHKRSRCLSAGNCMNQTNTYMTCGDNLN